MFIWFNKNKFNYEKGQLAPIFIVILVILIIMAMVTVNLSKVSLIKTDSANAVDSGALAGGSVMANVFNSLAKANGDMEFWYWTFYTSVSVSYVIAYSALINAARDACSNCSALAHLNTAIATMFAILAAVSAYWLAQWYFYRLIRDMGTEGKENAIKIAHRFTFMNSGIGGKLKEGSPPAEVTSPEQKRNYGEEFTGFLNNLGSDKAYTYSWRDGDNRAHSATSQVGVDDVDKFSLRVTSIPNFATVAGLLTASIALSYVAKIVIKIACAEKRLCWLAIGLLVAIIVLLLSTQVGLLPGGTVTSNSESDALPYIICWIEDVDHDRKFRVDTDQHHEGADLGLWETKYPDTHSYSIVDFTGDGQIHEPLLKHDASIVETDT
jgi:hypothetical protein